VIEFYENANENKKLRYKARQSHEALGLLAENLVPISGGKNMILRFINQMRDDQKA
jgi:hypothetical protein